MRDPEKYKEWYEKNKEKLKQQSHERYLKRDKNKMKEYRKANPEKVKKWAKNYREKNPDKIRQFCKKWQEKNPEYRSQYYKNHEEEVKAASKKLRTLKKDFINNLKLESGCIQCGSKEKLHFHHLNRAEKEINPANLVSRKLETIIYELSKCVVMCQTCHLKLHINDLTREERAERGRKAMLGRKHSPETIEKYKATWARKKAEGYKYQGHKHNEKTKAIISQKAKERWEKWKKQK